MPVDADLNRTDVESPGCELKGLRTWKDICLVRNSLQHQVCTPLPTAPFSFFIIVKRKRRSTAAHDTFESESLIFRGFKDFIICVSFVSSLFY